MELINEISAMIQLGLNELGAIIITLMGVLGIIKLLKNQIKELFKK